MKSPHVARVMAAIAALAALSGIALATQDRDTLKVTDGLAFAEFRGYERWGVIAISENGNLIAAILGNRAMIEAFQSGIPGNGKPFPDGAKMAKIHWNPKKNPTDPGHPIQPGALHDVDFMVKDSKRFADSGGWGWAAFEYDPTADAFRPANASDKPPQGNDAKCGFQCHTEAKDRDYVFTAYAKR
jgi:hypothetical protein